MRMHKCMSVVMCNAQACTWGDGGAVPHYIQMQPPTQQLIVQVWATMWMCQLLFVAKQGVCTL